MDGEKEREVIHSPKIEIEREKENEREEREREKEEERGESGSERWGGKEERVSGSVGSIAEIPEFCRLVNSEIAMSGSAPPS